MYRERERKIEREREDRCGEVNKHFGLDTFRLTRQIETNLYIYIYIYIYIYREREREMEREREIERERKIERERNKQFGLDTFRFY